MQIKGKILTIAGIVLIFGYFISESFKDPSDPTQVVMVGNDTLGRDWGAMAEQIEREKMQQQNGGVEEGIEVLSGEMDESANTSLLDPSQDPLNRQKLDQNNYSFRRISRRQRNHNRIQQTRRTRRGRRGQV
jgi:hypothetical protein